MSGPRPEMGAVSSERARELAAAIEAINLELVQLVRGCSGEQWRTLCNDEGDNRTVAVIAHHVAHGHVSSLEWLETALAGREVAVTLDKLDLENAEHAATYHEVERETTLALLEANGALLAERIANLTDEQLAGTAHHRATGRDLTVDSYAKGGHGHVAGHLATIRKALDL